MPHEARASSSRAVFFTHEFKRNLRQLVLQRDLSIIASERHSHVTLSAAKGLDEAVGTDASLRSA